jgi:hypothetical protein
MTMTETQTRYYITITEYVGPNERDAYGRRHRSLLRIGTEPPRTNMSREVQTRGWLGTTNDWASYAHGEYDTLEEAMESAQRSWKTFVLDDEDEGVYLLDDPSLVAVLGMGDADPWSVVDAEDWLTEPKLLYDDIRQDPSDEGIARLAERLTEEAKGDGITVDGIEEALLMIRDDALAG